MAVVDTSVFIALERRGLSLGALVAAVPDPDEGAVLAAVTASELLVGVHCANSPERQTRRSAFVEAILAVLPVVPFDLRIARLHAVLQAQLLDAGSPIGAHDLLIGATALAMGQRVFTDNIRDLGRIPGLEVHQPRWK